MAETIEREYQELIVENGRSSVQPTNPDNASQSESHGVQELAMEHKPESPDSESANLDIATPSQAPGSQEPAVDNTCLGLTVLTTS